MAIERLTALAVSRVSKPGMHADGGNLWLQISPAGTKSWAIRYTLAGKARQMGIGSVLDVSLSEARDMAREARRLLNAGQDPIEERRARQAAKRADDAKTLTFRQAAERFIAAHTAGWRSEKHADQWRATLQNYAHPTLGDLPVSAIDTAMVLTALENVWTAKPETASRVRGRIESILSWAIARGFRTGPNPAAWRGHLDRLLPAKSKVRRVQHHPAVPIDELPALMTALRANPSSSSSALQFMILSAARTAEVIGAVWDEVDLQAKTWVIPAERMKSAREHRVPLSDEAVTILDGLPREKGNPHLFLGGRKGRGLSNMAMLALLKGLPAFSAYVPHGLRSSFRDWCGERTAFPRELAEQALAHVVGDETERAYRRSDALERRRKLMTAWARFATRDPASGGATDNVRPIRGAA